jgi:hypothetical protein
MVDGGLDAKNLLSNQNRDINKEIETEMNLGIEHNNCNEN